jgi:hypothetical protein
MSKAEPTTHQRKPENTKRPCLATIRPWLATVGAEPGGKHQQLIAPLLKRGSNVVAFRLNKVMPALATDLRIEAGGYELSQFRGLLASFVPATTLF